MTALMRGLRQEMNGEVSAYMTNSGIEYPLNYGVSLHTIKAHAKEFAPDHGFAKFLYGQQVRELQLASFIIAEADAVTEGELDFWAAGIKNIELAENLASSLLCRTSVVNVVCELWLADDALPLLKYAAMLTLAKALDNGLANVSAQKVAGIVSLYAESDVAYLRRGAEMLEVRLDVDEE